MAGKPSKTPWRDGFWFSEKLPAFIFVIRGEKSEGKNFIGLDYPDIQVSNSLVADPVWGQENTTTGDQEFMVSKVLCVIFGNLHSLHFLPLSPLWCNFKNKIGAEPLTSSFPGPLKYISFKC